MQDAVKRILEGNFNNGIHSLEFSDSVIELNLHEGENYEGSFTIFGRRSEVTEGRVSSTRLRMKLLVDEFCGPMEEIAYFFDASGMSEGETLKGEFRIISNQGEYYVPYSITIASKALQSGMGDIKNLFHFANLARSNWEEAVNLFHSKDFERVFQGVDRQYYGIYRGLAGGKCREQNVEEFLLEIKKKQKVEFILEESEIRIDNPDERMENRLIINRNGWGYSELFIEVEGSFLVLEKEIIREEDFLGNCCRLPFYLSEKELHGGRNYGCIRLYNPYVSLTANITVVNKSVTARLQGVRMQKKHTVMELMQYYEAFRTKKISGALWMKETGRLVEALIQMDERDPAAKLFQVQLLITEERANEAKWFLDQAKAILDESFEPALYCYYLYLTTLLDRQESYIDEVESRVERIFAQNSDNWRIAWLLLYLGEDYTRSPSKKWLVLEEQFKQGCKSPVLYIEAWNLIASNPVLLMRLGAFELQVLFYAARKELLTPGVIEQVVYLARKQKNYSERLFLILKACYKVTPSDEVLRAVCTMLIKGNITSESVHLWYAKGIERELRITRLYEYYMMSLPLKDDTIIPKIVLMYFAFDSNLDSLHNSFLYAYVYRNKGQYPELYLNYREQIERFVVSQILKGKNNSYLAYLYKNLITEATVTQETAKGLSVVLFMQQLTVLRSDIRKVILVYDKETKEVVYPVSGKEVYLSVYGSDYSLLLEDSRGNRYCRKEEYTLLRLMKPDGLAFMIAPYVTDCVHFDLWLCEKGREIGVVSEKNVEYMKRITTSELIIEEVQQEIRMKLIHFFYEEDRMKELDDYLTCLTPEQIDGGSFAQVVRFMVLRGMYEKAYEWINLRGGEGVEAKLIVRLCSRLLAMEDFAEDDTMTGLAFFAFKAGKYDERLLEYLCAYFRGTSREMRDLWKAAEAFGLDTYGLCQRILMQMLYTGAYVGERDEIFRRYISGGAKTEVALAILAQCSYDYFVGEKLTDEFVLQEIQRIVERQEELPFVCRLAYTKYYAENKEQINEVVSRYLIIFLREILAQDKYFPYFMEYADNIAFMRQFMDKTMVEYRISDKSRAVIHYLIEKDGESEGEYIEEEMQNMFGGVCVKQFILFFGERLQYYITESEGGKENLTQSGTLSYSDTKREHKESRYGMLNDISIGRNMNDYDTMEELLHEYFEQDYLVRELFLPVF